MGMYEESRLYQAALEDRRARRNEIGDGYLTTEERRELARLDGEVDGHYAAMLDAWLAA